MATAGLRPSTASVLAPAATLLTLSFFLMIGAGPAGATTIRVPEDQPTIQAAINIAVPGDSLVVAAGTYTGPANRDLDLGGKDLILFASEGPASTIIDCEQQGRGFLLMRHETIACRIVGFTVTNAFADGEAGAVLMSDAGASFENCVFQNSRGDAGGGIWCNRSMVVITDCTFSENIGDGNSDYAGYGGGLWIDRLSNATVTNSSFERNASKRGGGVWVGGGAIANLVDCTFTANAARSWGGGLATGGVTTVLRVTRSTFTGNSATSAGGGAFILDTDPEFTDCRFIENTSPSRGGGLFMSASAPVLERALFAGNSAVEAGGGLLSYGSMPIIRSSTFHGNSCPLGGGIYVGATDGPSAAVVERSIIAFGTAGEAIYCEPGSSADVACSDVFGNAGGDWVGCLADQLGQDGNFAADPMFCNAAGGDFRIDASSPCAPANSPPGCALIGAFPEGCGSAAMAGGAPPVPHGLRVAPNPLFGDGKIEWTSEGRTPLALELYDATGRLAARRDLEPLASGRHALAWSDVFAGRRFASGIYFLRATGGSDASAVVRVVIMP